MKKGGGRVSWDAISLGDSTLQDIVELQKEERPKIQNIFL
jgi:hypothetical protein